MRLLYLNVDMLSPSSRRDHLRLTGLAIVGTLLFGLAGTSCSRSALVAPSGTAITLIASTNNLPVNGSADITAVLIEGSFTSGANGGVTTTTGTGAAVHDGTQVSFTTTLGRIEPADAETDGGKAVVKLYGDGRSGTATITAISGAASKTLAVTVGAAGATRIAVTANPEALPATGGTATIVASVDDAQGNGLSGVPVSFSTTAGNLSATTVVSDNSGSATTTLTTNAAATVTASSGGASAALSGTVNVTLKNKTSVTVQAPTSITVSVPATFIVGVTATGGATPIVNDVTVDFGDGSTPASLGQISASTTVTHLYGRSGSLTMKVTATDPDGSTTSITPPVVVAPLSAVGAAQPSTVALGASMLFTVTPVTGAIIDHYVWDFGEGDPPISSVSNAQSHVYLTKGGHTATVTVVPSAGPALILQIPIVIN
jgi:hypothetical protein